MNPIFDILLRHFDLLSQLKKYLAFKSFDFESNWCWLFQIWVVGTKFDIYVWLNLNMRVSYKIWTKCVFCTLDLISVILLPLLLKGKHTTLRMWNWIASVRFSFISISQKYIRTQNMVLWQLGWRPGKGAALLMKSLLPQP